MEDVTGAMVREARVKLGLTQGEFAKNVGVSRFTINQTEGRSKINSPLLIAKIDKAVGGKTWRKGDVPQANAQAGMSAFVAILARLEVIEGLIKATPDRRHRQTARKITGHSVRVLHN